MNPSAARPMEAQDLLSTGLRFSICTLVTRTDQYADMLASFRDKGFGAGDCEFLQIDNREGNRRDGYEGVNLFLTVARGDYIIVCHQDVLLIDDRSALERALAELDAIDPAWGACGNCGGLSPGRLAVRLSDPHGEDQRTAGLPARVVSLDENFILVRRAANLSVSGDLAGFHLYGTDLCILADVLGRSTWVIDFHLRHLSGGRRDETLVAARGALVAKYSRAFRPRWVNGPCELVFVSGAGWLSRLLSSRWPVGVRRRLGGWRRGDDRGRSA